jgi:hypothetical protein
MSSLARLRFQHQGPDSNVDTDLGTGEGDAKQEKDEEEAEMAERLLDMWVEHELRAAILESGMLNELSSPMATPRLAPSSAGETRSREWRNRGEASGQRPSSSGAAATPGCKTAKLATDPPDDKLLAKVLVTFLSKREPLSRIVEYYRSLNTTHWSEKGGKPSAPETMALEIWNRFLKDFGMLPAMLGLRAADIIHKRSFCSASARSHPLYAQFCLALANVSLFAFPAETVEVRKG